MAFDLQAGFGAGAGADMLQQILRQKAQEAFQNQSLANEQQKMALLQQEQQQRAAIQQAQLESINEERKTNEAAKNRAIFGELPPGTALDPATAAMGRSVGLGPLIPHEAASLPSTDIYGNVTPESTAAGGQALKMVGLRPEQDTYLGTAAQQDTARRQKMLQDLIGSPDLSPEAKLAIQYEQATGKNPPSPLVKPSPATRLMNIAPGGTVFDPDTQQPVYSAPNRPDKPQIVPVMTIDDQGNPVTRMVTKQAGDVYQRPVSGVLENRIKGAQTVTEMGNDIIKQVTDPKVAATLGPVMGRYSSIQDFIGNPPPEYSELAGEIESYALANMGVHGMRSAQGAQMIQKLLSGKHTPESLAATVRGLNKFSTAFVQNATPGGSATTPSLSTPAVAAPAPNIIRYDMNGNVIKQE